MEKYEETICLKIYEENEMRLSWYLRKKCMWLNEEDIYDVMQEVWKALSENIQKVGMWDGGSQWKWLASVAYKQAAYYARKNSTKEKLIGRMQEEELHPAKVLTVEEVVIQKITAENIMKKLSRKEKEVLFGDLLETDDSKRKQKGNAAACKSYRARKKLEKHMREGGLSE